MKRSLHILISSHAFYPSVGGIETASAILTNGMMERGHKVTMVTATPGGGDDDRFPFPVVRSPSMAALIKLIFEADVVWQNNISLRTLWPLAFIPRPVIIMHHTWLNSEAGLGSGLARMKRLACLRAHNVFVSRALMDAAGLRGVVIPNPYNDAIYRVMPEISRDRDIAFVGRLVSDKGADVLIDALAMLAQRGIRMTSTIIGAGPELEALKNLANARGIGDSVSFPGALHGANLARQLNRHGILVVPSRWKEPFGIVALEGIACGCVAVGTSGGGLPEAIGDAGTVISNGDPRALAETLTTFAQEPDRLEIYRNRAQSHLARFTSARVLDGYEELLLRCANGGAR